MGDMSCFVIMPFGERDSDDFRHWESIYEYYEIAVTTHFRDPNCCRRADTQVNSSDIVEKIIQNLVEADIVIADLTHANPNVMYELGVRHALRRRVTILTLDTSRSKQAPFNLHNINHISYNGSDASVFSQIRNGITRVLKEIDEASDFTSNSIVHNVYKDKQLPDNLISAYSGTQTEKDQQEIRRLKEELDAIKRANPELVSINRQKTGDNPFDMLEAVLTEYKDGTSPEQLLKEAETATRDRDAQKFLGVLLELRKMKRVRPSNRDFLRIFMFSKVFNIDEMPLQVLRIARSFYPNDADLKRFEISELVRGGSPDDIKQARKELMALLPADLSDERAVKRRIESADFRIVLTAITDAFYQQENGEEGENLSRELLQYHPDDSCLLRSLARATAQSKGFIEGLKWHRASVVRPNEPEDVNAVWLGNELHNNGYRAHAVEAYALACTMDPSDAMNFTHIADEVLLYLRDDHGDTKPNVRKLPEEVANKEYAKRALIMAVSALASQEQLGPNSLNDDILERVFRHLEGGDMDSFAQENQAEVIRTTLGDRRTFANGLYNLIKSDLTLTENDIPLDR